MKKRCLINVVAMFLLFCITGVQAQQQQILDFITACNAGNMKVVKRTEKDGFDINSKLKADGSTALMIAAAAGQNEVIRFLIEKGAAVNAKKDFGYTALMSSIINNETETASLLIEKGAEVNALTKINETPMSLAIEKCNTPLLSLLIEKGADINFQTKVDQKPLLIAATKGCEDVIGILIENGIDIEQANEADSTTALMKAAKFGHYESVEFLLENRAQINKKNRQGNSAIMFAVQYGHLDILQLLLEKGADINDNNILGFTPLLYALDYHQTEMVEYLIENGAEVNVETKNEVTPLKIVKEDKDSLMVAYLVEHGAIEQDTTKVKTEVVAEADSNRNAATPSDSLTAPAEVDSSTVWAFGKKDEKKELAKDVADSTIKVTETNKPEKTKKENVKPKRDDGIKKNQTGKAIIAGQDSIKEVKMEDLIKLAQTDSVPKPEGGFEKIQEHLKIPKIVQEGKISGTIVINVKIDEDGKILHTKFVTLLMNKKCNAAALNAIKSVKWIAAKKDGKPTTAEIDVPIEFKPELTPDLVP